MVIGRNFVKQYYQVLSTAPENIVKFYKPVSLFSHGQGSEPTTPATIAESTENLLKDRLFSSQNFRVDLERGAIDAQSSVDGGVLVVVTGHLFIEEEKRAFSHTFFLNPSVSAADSTRKQYYVHNDIMRFLAGDVAVEEEVQEEEEVATARVTPEQTVVENRQEEVLLETIKETTSAAPTTVVEETVVETEVVSEPVVAAAEETPMYEPALEPEPAVEETKEDIVAEEQKDSKSKRKSKSRRKKSLSPTAAEEKAQPTPGSWASMVAHNSSTPAPPSPTRRPAAEKKDKEVSAKDDGKIEKSVEQQSQQQQHQGGRQQRGPKLRDPDCTLVIKNVPEGTKEREVREMFEPFAVETKSKIVGLNVSGNKSLAFVDYDSPEPVLAALKQKGQLQLNGRTLDLEPKLVDKSRFKNYRTRSAGEGGGSSNGFRGSGRSGGQHRRRGSGGGRGDRGGGGRGGRGGR